MPGFLASAFPSVFGGVPEGFRTVYHCARFSGVVLAVVVHLAMMAGARATLPAKVVSLRPGP